ncbi:hypothetical protein LINGRAHAP2_LOCUS13742 [Linum grandiflorum]
MSHINGGLHEGLILSSVAQTISSFPVFLKWLRDSGRDNDATVVLRVVCFVCLVYMNFDSGLDKIVEIIESPSWKNVAEQLPIKFNDKLGELSNSNSVVDNREVIVTSFEMIEDSLVIENLDGKYKAGSEYPDRVHLPDDIRSD